MQFKTEGTKNKLAFDEGGGAGGEGLSCNVTLTFQKVPRVIFQALKVEFFDDLLIDTEGGYSS